MLTLSDTENNLHFILMARGLLEPGAGGEDGHGLLQGMASPGEAQGVRGVQWAWDAWGQDERVQGNLGCAFGAQSVWRYSGLGLHGGGWEVMVGGCARIWSCRGVGLGSSGHSPMPSHPLQPQPLCHAQSPPGYRCGSVSCTKARRFVRCMPTSLWRYSHPHPHCPGYSSISLISAFTPRTLTSRRC